MFTVVLLFLTFINAEAQSSVCPTSESKALVRCLVNNHPKSKSSSLLAEKAEGERDAGRRFLNPEVTYETTKGRLLGDTQGTNRVSVSYPIELFGQRGARVDLGDANSKLALIEKAKSENEVFAEVVLNLVKYRQILIELEVVTEGVSAYTKVVSHLSSRPKLTPEHEVSLSIFRLAQGDLGFKKTELIDEQRKIEDFFSHVPFNILSAKAALPKPRENWPNVAKEGEVAGSPYFQQHTYNVDRANAIHSEAKGRTWPVLKASAIMEQNISGPAQYTGYGFGITAEIPLLSFNLGERQSARADASRAQIEAEIGKKDVLNERQRLVEHYNSSVNELKKAPKRDVVEKKHANVEALYYRGLISTSLLIEVHRQLLDFISNQHVTEVKALEALMKIKAIDGKLNEDIL